MSLLDSTLLPFLSKGLSRNNLTISHPIFGPSLNAPQSKKPQHSPGYASAFPQSFRPNLAQILARYCEGYFLTGPNEFFSEAETFFEKVVCVLVVKEVAPIVVGRRNSHLFGPEQIAWFHNTFRLLPTIPVRQNLEQVTCGKSLNGRS